MGCINEQYKTLCWRNYIKRIDICLGGIVILEIKSFYKEYEDMFEEYLDDVKRILRKKSKIYKLTRKIP